MKTVEARPIARLTLWLTIVLIAAMANKLMLAIAYGLHGLALADFAAADPLTMFDPVPGAQGVEAVLTSASLLLVVLALSSGALALIWIRRANQIAHVFAWNIQATPLWSVLWWFIPGAALFKPYGVFSEILRSSQDPDRWRALGDRPQLRWWWGLHLVGGLCGSIASFLERRTATVADVVLAEQILIVSLVVQLVAGCLFLGLIKRIARSQTQLMQQGRRRPKDTGSPAWSA
ncbi:hypothetical protein LTR94_026938 [Friedmanniomyces endolithicus]|nr:hypothetical protein LTR94_026938 [Friedmanniomyces endolithicus]